MFFEFLVRIAAHKYKNSGTKGVITGVFVPPAECFEKFMHEDYHAWLK